MKKICLFGGPGLGKSTTAARLFSDLKACGQHAEYASEFIKQWAYLKRVPRGYDQLFIFGSQIHAEDVLRQAGVAVVVSDSPVLMQCAYAKKHGCPYWADMVRIAGDYESSWTTLNLFLGREGIPYRQDGRYEDAGQAAEMDEFMAEFLGDCGVQFLRADAAKYEEIWRLASDFLEISPG